MKKLKDKINQAWAFVNGKKTKIGLGLHIIWAVTNLAIPVTSPFSEVGHASIFLITGVGLGHKGIKLLNNEKQNRKGN